MPAQGWLPGELAPGLPSRPDASASPEVLLESGPLSVKTADGLSWRFRVEAFTGGKQSGLTATLRRPEEGHEWRFTGAKPVLTFDAKTGVGTVTSGTVSSPVATTDLTFKASSHGCSEGEMRYKGSLTGEAELVTGLAGGGTVGGTSVSFGTKSGSSELFVFGSGCTLPPPSTKCENSAFFYAYKGSTAVTGGTGKLADSVGVDHIVTLSAPKGASRIDGGAAALSSPLAWNATTHVLSASAISSGIVTGSVTLSGGVVSTATGSCTAGGKKHRETATSNETALYASPAGKAITAHLALGGVIAMPVSVKHAMYQIVAEQK